MPKRVLVVDDDPVHRRILEETVKRIGYAVALAENGDKALAALKADVSGDISLVLLDLVMRGTGHKIPELEPRFAARWVKEIVRGNAKLSHGRTFTGTPWKGVATSDSVVVDGLGAR